MKQKTHIILKGKQEYQKESKKDFPGGASTCQRRGHGFNRWSGKIPHTKEEWDPWAETTEPVCCRKRSHHKEKAVHHNKRADPAYHN